MNGKNERETATTDRATESLSAQIAAPAISTPTSQISVGARWT